MTIWPTAAAILATVLLTGPLSTARGQSRADTVPAAAPAALAPPAADAATATIIQRFLARHDPDLGRHRATRRLEASARGGRTTGWLEARTELSDSGFRYDVLSEGGNGIIRGRVLKAALNAEASMRQAKDDAGAALTTANYEFTGAGRDP
jgi:hypothetical protein